MARPLATPDTSTGDQRQQGRSARGAARAFAAALSVLLVTTLVIDRSASTIRVTDAEVTNSFEAGTIELTDDDAGRSLFRLSDMAPGRPAVRCIDIVYGGTILPVELSLAAQVDGALAPYMQVLVERGSGGSFESCDGFEPSGVVFDGSLAELSELTERAGLPVADVLQQDETVSFRFRFELDDDENVVGRLATSTFVWEAVPS